MEQIPKLVIDLAYILIVAGVVTIIFKRLRQPLVLGYIIAGFLAGPNMPYTPSVADIDSISDWSQIGVIFLMFTLGLEFSFKKIVKMGLSPIFAAICVMLCMISVGSGVGHLFGWNNMDRLFLGGMLAMSSTTIIYKAFDDLGIRTRKFVSSVLSVLIIEDILGILLMVILSALAVSRKFEGMQLINNLLHLGFFLILWFIVGVFIIPIFLRKFNKYINSETLLIVSVGLCFVMVVISSSVGYSPAFGAFMMGSILAETVEAERIEKTISSLKDFFGAIFFVSVGMMVDYGILTQYWLPIVVITLSIIIGQMIFGTFSFLVSGHSLKEAIQCGFSLAQIGEFAFIIATLGQSLKVTSEFLYPVVVAVSIITTFFTPYMIRMAEPAYALFDRVMPVRLVKALNYNHAAKQKESKKVTVSVVWKKLLRAILSQTVAYLTLSLAIILFSYTTLLPLCSNSLHLPGNIICAIITFLMISPCIRPIVMRKNHSIEAHIIRCTSLNHALLFWLLFLIRFTLVCLINYNILHFLFPNLGMWNIIISIVLVILIIMSRRVKYVSIRMERTFLKNLHSRESQSSDKSPAYGRRLRGKDLHIASLTLPPNTAWGGKKLSELQFGKTQNIHIVAIVKGTMRINIPGGSNKLFPGDILEVVGDDTSIDAFSQRIQSEVISSDSHYKQNSSLSLIQLHIGPNSPFCNRTLVEMDLRSRYHCMVIGVESTEGEIQMLHSNEPIKSGSLLWIVGEDADLSLLKMGI